jgi:amidase
MNFSRRGLLAASAAIAAASAADAKPKTADAPAPWTPDATEMAGRIRRKEVSAVEVVEDAIRKAEALQPKIGALVTSDFDRAMDKAKSGRLSGPFAGVPFLVKDLDPYKGLPTRYGSRAMLGAQPAGPDRLYRRLRPGRPGGDRQVVDAGIRLPADHRAVGFLPTRNPWNLEALVRRLVGRRGGRDLGRAWCPSPTPATAAARSASLRSNCGLFGLKPSRGRMIEGRPGSRGIDLSVAHCVSHSVRDSAALFSRQRAHGGRLALRLHRRGRYRAATKRKLKVGLVMNTGTGHKPDPEVIKAIENAAKLMAGLGHHVEPTDWPMDGAQFGADFTALWATGAAELVAGVSKAIGRKPDASVLEPFSLGMAELVGNAEAGSAGGRRRPPERRLAGL